jgi:hypothetical protein
VAVAYGAPTNITLPAGGSTAIAVRVVNAGSEAWDVESHERPDLAGEALLTWLASEHVPARLAGTWVVTGTSSLELPAPAEAVLDLSTSAPGGSGSVVLDLVAPEQPGEYLLLLDVLAPELGPLSAKGQEPAIIRVAVTAADPTPAASPTGAPPVTPAFGPSTAPPTPAVPTTIPSAAGA